MSSEVVGERLKNLGGSSFDKALQVNLDPTIYGSFAEIGAGQEVSRTFLTAGAAAGTVARSLSAYDMQMSDVTYGKAKRYVTEERLMQMLKTEYDELEKCIRTTKGPECRFFSFASTLAAKAYMSDRECEGWVGLTYQHEAGAAPSTVRLHIRMTDPTAQQQGQAIGVLGTNLLYLCNGTTDPFIISTFLLDSIEEGRLEVDYVDFSGPAFPEGSFDPRLLAMRMVQFRVAVSVLMLVDEKTGQYKMAVPNNSLYKKSVIVQRSRFRPVTYTHREIMDATKKQLQQELGEGASPMELLNLQIDEFVRPSKIVASQARKECITKLMKADADGDGFLTLNEVRSLLPSRMPAEEQEKLLQELDLQETGSVSIDALMGFARDSFVSTEFLDRFNMLQPLGFPVLISGLSRTHVLAEYLSRYTREKIAVVVGGGNYSIERGLFNSSSFQGERGGMLEAFGRLFSGNAQIYQYPNISFSGEVSTSIPQGSSNEFLHNYLIAEGKIVPIKEENMFPAALDKTENKKYRGQSEDVIQLIQDGSAEWVEYVPREVAEIVKKRTWYSKLAKGSCVATSAYKILNNLC